MTRRSPSSSVGQQLETLAKLEPGWFDGDGSAYDPVQLAWLAELLVGVTRRHRIAVPYMYPTPEGDVRAEWPGERWEVSVTFVLGAREARLFAVDLGSRDFVERTAWLDDPGGEGALARFLQVHVGSSREAP